MHKSKKNRIFFSVVALLALLSALILVSCNKGQPAETSGTGESASPATTEQNIIIPEDENLTIEENAAVIVSGNSEIRLSVEKDRLYVDSLTLNGGANRMAGRSRFLLPAGYYDGVSRDTYDWYFVSADRFYGVERGVESSGVTFRFKSETVIADVTCRHYPSAPGTFEFFTSLTNVGKSYEETCPNTFASFSFTKGNSDRVFYVAKESGAAEGFVASDRTYSGTGIYNYELKKGTSFNIWVSTFQSWNSSGYIPMAYITSDDSYGVYTALEWSSGRVIVGSDGDRNTVKVDMDDVSKTGGEFCTKIPAGGTLVLPNVYLGAYEGDVDDGSNAFKKWYFACKSPASMRSDKNEPYSQMDMQSGLDTHGVEAIKWDYGWWDSKSRGSCGNWNAHEGSWILRSESYKNVLKNYGCTNMTGFGALAHENGVKWTVYVLLHDTLSALDKPTNAFNEFNSIDHPEWFSNRVIDKGMGASADLGNPECVAYLQKIMTEFFKTNNVDTWRSDFEPIAYWSDKENRHNANGTDVQYWNTVGFEELVTYLIDNVDGFRYESCSSGGSMKDLFTAKYASVINTDDVANYLSLRMTFYDSSYVINPAQLQSPCNVEAANPGSGNFWPKIENTNMTGTDFQDNLRVMEYRSQILCAPMFSSWSGRVYGSLLEEYTDIYSNRVKPLIRDGDLYHILPRPDGKNWDGVMYADADSQNEIKGVIFVFKPDPAAGDSVTFRLRGLYADKTYSLSFDDHPGLNLSATGAELMEKGVTVTITDCIGSDMIWITENK